jgi:hypothetical protein
MTWWIKLEMMYVIVMLCVVMPSYFYFWPFLLQHSSTFFTNTTVDNLVWSVPSYFRVNYLRHHLGGEYQPDSVANLMRANIW